MITVDAFGLTEGELPLAVSTSSPIETIMIDPRLHGVKIAINISTLIRNWLGCIDYRGEILPKQIGDFVINEMNIISMILKEKNSEAIFYVSDVGPLYKRMVLIPYLRKQKELDLYTPVIAKYIMHQRNISNVPREEWYYHHGLRYNTLGQHAIVLSHNNLDYVRSNVDVLESHTGKFKLHHQLHDKYSPMKDGTGSKVNLERIPFVEELLLIMGTKSLFKIKKPAMRATLLEVATRHKWNPKMTRLKLQSGLSDPSIRGYYESLPKL